MDKANLDVIHDDELTNFLKKLKVFDEITNGKKKCKFCKSVITLENLHSLFAQAGDIKFVCDQPECINKLTEHINDGSNNS